MSVLAGILVKQDRSSLLLRMLKSLDHFNYETKIFNEKNVFLGGGYINNKYTENKFYVTNDKKYICFINGEIFSYNDNPVVNDAKFLVEEYINNGLINLVNIDGQYSAIIYCSEPEKLILLNDRYGTHPLYYTLNNHSFYFASEVKAILQADIKKEIDYSAISDLFHYGHLFGYKTMFKNIRQLPEASYLIYEKNNITIKKYWEFPYYEEVYKKKSFSKKEITKYIDEMIFVMEDSVSIELKKTFDKALLSLSGGLDSRWVIALSAKKNIDRFIAFTMGESRSEDAIYAKMVAGNLNINHSVFSIDPYDIWSDAKYFSHISDYMSMINGPVQGFRPLQFFYKKADITLSSQMCDALYGSTLSHKKVRYLLNQSTWNKYSTEVFLSLFVLFNEQQIKMVLQTHTFEIIKDIYKETPSSYIENYNNIMFAYYNILMNEHGRRGTLGGNILNNLFFETRMPSYSNKVIEFGYKLPISLRKNQFIYRKAFNKLFPDLAKIPREGLGLPLNAPDYKINLKKIENRIINKVKNTKYSNIVLKFDRWNKPNYVSYGHWFRNELKGNIVNLIENMTAIDNEFFNLSGIKKIIDRHLSNEQDNSRLIWQIINLKYFLDENFD